MTTAVIMIYLACREMVYLGPADQEGHKKKVVWVARVPH